MNQQSLVENVVKEVLRQLGSSAGGLELSSASGPRPYGIYSDVNLAVAAAKKAQRQLVEKGKKARKEICQLLRTIPIQNDKAWAKMEFEESKVGRLDHKIAKLHFLADIPGVEAIESRAKTGDEGVVLDEAAPWGVIGCITPVTHSIPTLTANAINMIAAGNAMVVNPHPSAYRCASEAVKTYNRAIFEITGISELICLINPPTLESANAIFAHPDVPMLVVTGGPAVAKAAMTQGKRAVAAGPGNPPVVVDETADLARAAESIITGASFDNNLLCIGEKEVFVVESVFEQMMLAMERCPAPRAYRLNASEVEKLTRAAFSWKDNHFMVSKDFVGKDTEILAAAAGVSLPAGVKIDLLYGETNEDNPFVAVEQMMPFVPFVRVPNVSVAIDMAVKYEHGYGHTGIIHSTNLANITRMGQRMNTTIFIANGPCTVGLGAGEGHTSFSIATPTGEGITSPMTFTRYRRMSISRQLYMA